MAAVQLVHNWIPFFTSRYTDGFFWCYSPHSRQTTLGTVTDIVQKNNSRTVGGDCADGWLPCGFVELFRLIALNFHPIFDAASHKERTRYRKWPVLAIRKIIMHEFFWYIFTEFVHRRVQPLLLLFYLIFKKGMRDMYWSQVVFLATLCFGI